MIDFTPITSFCDLPASSQYWSADYEPRQSTTLFLKIDDNAEEKNKPKNPWQTPLQELRNDLHATVQQLSSALGVERQTYHAWLRGEKIPSPKNQQRIHELVDACTLLQNTLGLKLPIYLSNPIGSNGESYFLLLENGNSISDTTRTLIEHAEKSIRRRATFRSSIAGLIPLNPIHEG